MVGSQATKKMPDYRQIANAIEAAPFVIRKNCMQFLHKKHGRNIILYYSGWLHKTEEKKDLGINELDKNRFMQMLSGWDKKQRKKGLDLILHTPGGEVSATESIGNYLREMFYKDIRVIVPQIAMSGGTAWACMGTSIFMGKHSSLGPTDMQFGDVAASYIKQEIEMARKEYPKKEFWEPILSEYNLGLYTDCKNSIEWSKEIVRKWLSEGMFAKNKNKAKKIAEFLSGGKKTHERQISAAECHKMGLNIKKLEDNQEVQDAVLSLHHACMWEFENTNTIKIVENHAGISEQEHE